jgi:hypothetical protein
MGFFNFFGGNETPQPKTEAEKPAEAVSKAEQELDTMTNEYFEKEEAKYEGIELPSDEVKFEDLGKDDEQLDQAA